MTLRERFEETRQAIEGREATLKGQRSRVNLSRDELTSRQLASRELELEREHLRQSFLERYRLDLVSLTPGPVRDEGRLDLGRPRIAGVSPNPVRGDAEVEFAIPVRGPVRLRVYDVTGRVVRTLVDGALDAGAHRVRWDGRSETGGKSATGVYFLRLDTGNGSSSRKLVRLD